MTSVAQTCGVCTAPVSGAVLACQGCVDQLMMDIRVLTGWTTHAGYQVPGLLTDLLDTAARLDVMPPVGATDRELQPRQALAVAATPSPCRLDALKLRREIMTATAQVFLAAESVGIRRIAGHQDVVVLIKNIGRLVVRAAHMVDRPDGAFRVPCPSCERRVPIDVDRDIVKCSCGEWGTRDWWISNVAPEVLDATLMTAREVILWLIVRHRIAVNEAQLRQWVVRYPDRLSRAGKDQAGRTLYLTAQVLTLARNMAQPMAV